LSTILRNQICVTSRAILGFHAPRLVDEYGQQYHVPEVTSAVAATYTAPIRNWIRRHGGLTQRPIFLRGMDLTALYPLCR
jgi:hypothetical protein